MNSTVRKSLPPFLHVLPDVLRIYFKKKKGLEQKFSSFLRAFQIFSLDIGCFSITFSSVLVPCTNKVISRAVS